MIDVAWNIDDDDRDTELTGAPRPLLTTWHFLRNSLLREWRTWVGLAGLGAALGVAAAVLMPSSSIGTVTLLMAHPANLDGPAGMATDVSLLNTRQVAARTVRDLKLDMSPDEFQSTVTPEPQTDQILTITVSGPDSDAAVARTDALVKQYLDFRTTQMRSLSSGLISGYKARIGTKQDQVNALNRQYRQAIDQGKSGQSKAYDILAKRTELNSEIADAQQAIENASLQTEAAVASTHVIDAAAPVNHSAKKAMVLDAGSGLIGGAALGVVFVLFRALTSDRLRRRQDVALALGAPVRFSVASAGPSESRFKGPWQRLWARIPSPAALRRGPWRGHDLEVLVLGLMSAVMPQRVTSPPARSGGSARKRASTNRKGPSKARKTAQPPAGRQSGGGGRTAVADEMAGSQATNAKRSGPLSGVALAAIGNVQVAAAVVAATASHLRSIGLTVLSVDLTASGALVSHPSPIGAPSAQVESTGQTQGTGTAGDGSSNQAVGAFRPTGVPWLAQGPRATASGTDIGVPDDGLLRERWDTADVVLALVQVDPGIDVENLGSWVEVAVPLVTAGRSTAELLETTAELIRAAGVTMPFAMMAGSDDLDESLGLVDLAEAEPTGSASQR